MLALDGNRNPADDPNEMQIPGKFRNTKVIGNIALPFCNENDDVAKCWWGSRKSVRGCCN